MIIENNNKILDQQYSLQIMKLFHAELCSNNINNAHAKIRDVEKEKKIVMESKANLKLLSTLGTQEIYRWLPRGEKHGRYFNIDQYKIALRTFRRSNVSDGYAIRQIINALRANGENIRRVADEMFRNQEKIKTLGKDFNFEYDVYNNMHKANAAEIKAATQIYLQQHGMALNEIKSIGDRILSRAMIAVGAIFKGNEQTQLSLFDIYKLTGNWDDANHIERVFNEFGMLEDIYSPAEIDERTRWHQIDYQMSLQLPPLDQRALQLPNLKIEISTAFIDQNGKCYGNLLFLKNNDAIIQIPSTTWAKHSLESARNLYLPFESPYPIYSDNHSFNALCSNVIITPDIELVARYNNPPRVPQTCDHVYCSWYGEERTAVDVRWKLLAGRKVYYILHKFYNYDRKKIFEIAMSACCGLSNAGIDATFIDEDSGSASCYSISDFKREAEKLGVTEHSITRAIDASRGCLRRSREVKGIADIGEVVEQKYILRPAIPFNSITLLYSEAGIGKTWLALSLAYAAAVGCNPFPFRTDDGAQTAIDAALWKVESPVKVLYVDAEMGEVAFARRCKIVHEIYNPDGKLNFENFKYSSINADLLDMSIYDGEGMSHIESLLKRSVAPYRKDFKGGLLVLDNLLSLTMFNDSARAWHGLFKWLKELRDLGCSVLLVHHTNKKGEQRGTNVKVATVDNVIEVKNLEHYPRGSLGMSISLTKGRDLTAEDKIPIEVKLNVKEREWTICNQDRRIDEYIRRNFLTCPYKELAASLGMTVAKLNLRIKHLGLEKNKRKKKTKNSSKSSASKRNSNEKINDVESAETDAT